MFLDMYGKRSDGAAGGPPRAKGLCTDIAAAVACGLWPATLCFIDLTGKCPGKGNAIFFRMPDVQKIAGCRKNNDGIQQMISICPPSRNVQTEIDLCRRVYAAWRRLPGCSGISTASIASRKPFSRRDVSIARSSSSALRLRASRHLKRASSYRPSTQ